MEKLGVFEPAELQRLLCGESTIDWDLETLRKYTEPKHGYTHESVGYTQFLEVLAELDDGQRRAFLTFATGCPTLPPGGLPNLYPRLTVVRKTVEEKDGLDNVYPSVNTCHHYCKVPVYSSKATLKLKLLQAVQGSEGFDLA